MNLLISFIFHTLIVLGGLYLAARNGLLGHQVQKLTVTMVKAPVKPKAPEKPKELPPKIETPKSVPKPREEETKAAPPPVNAPPVVAPPAAELPAFEFAGGRAVETSSDPVHLYQGYMEYALRSKWQRPEDLDDAQYVAEVAVHVDRQGRISDPVWEKESGNRRWDDSVHQALAAVTRFDRPPPTNFPPRVIVRFDVQEETEPLLQ